jgi:hypothetical protein
MIPYSIEDEIELFVGPGGIGRCNPDHSVKYQGPRLSSRTSQQRSVYCFEYSVQAAVISHALLGVLVVSRQ